MDNSKEIQELRDKADKLEKQQKVWNERKTDTKVAEMIHAKTCSWNHTDGCGWEYESWDNIGSTREHYLKKAHAMLSESTVEECIRVLKYL